MDSVPASSSSSSSPHNKPSAADAGATSSAPSSATAVNARLKNELMQLMMNGSSEATAFPDGENWLNWKGTLKGTAGTPYESMTFHLQITFPSDYPYKPPTITFETPCFHPNVDQHGNICLDILKDQWSATYSVNTVLISLQSLLGDPNIDDPLNPQAAQLWNNQAEFRRVLRSKCSDALDDH